MLSEQSIFTFTILVFSFICGLLLPVLFLSYRKNVPNLHILSVSSSQSEVPKRLPRCCSICQREQCDRPHFDPFSSSSLHPHINFMASQSIDRALEELLNLVLDHYIYVWYREISVDDQLADEIRFLIRYSASSLGKRICKADIANVIVNQLIPAWIIHLNAYVEGSQGVSDALSTEGIFKYFSLTKIFVEELFGQYLILQGLDLLAKPDTINLILEFFLSGEDFSSPMCLEPTSSFLKSFVSVNTHPRNSVLRNNLSSVLRNQSLLYLFHSCLKEEDAINILSFCLAVEDFNRRILDPDLSAKQLEELHREALELYKIYMVPTSVDKINFQLSIVEQIRDIVNSDFNDIVKLRTTPPLFQAYEYAYNLLEGEFLPLFMNTNAYFLYLCGFKDCHNQQRNSIRHCSSNIVTNHPKSSGYSGNREIVVSEFHHHLMAGNLSLPLRPDELYVGSCLADEECSDSAGVRRVLKGLSSGFRDLSAWRVAIPRVEQRLHDTGKLNFYFIVDVTRIDVAEDDSPGELHWQVERQYHEFYILETKLKEFHGEFPENALPPRRSLFTSKGVNFMHSRRQIFEEFLKKLLQTPSLKGSQLLFLFLKMTDDFAPSYLPDVSLGQFLREVPKKLVKERGQNLDSFLQSFISAISLLNRTPTCNSEENSGSEPPSATAAEDEVLLDGNYAENCQLISSSKGLPFTPSSIMKISGPCECLLYVAVRIYGLSLDYVRWVLCLKALIGKKLDAMISWYLRKKLDEFLTSSTVVSFIHLIKDALFLETSKRSDAERSAREKSLRKKVANIFPLWAQKAFFSPQLCSEGTEALVDVFQHQILNKQLSYVFLDIMLEELFPELTAPRGEH